jgi:uncharacterized membrane protein
MKNKKNHQAHGLKVHFQRRLKAVHSLQARHNAKRSALQKMTDVLVSYSGTVAFLLFNTILFVAWILWNSAIGEKPFDPFPYDLLTTIVSLEAIILAILVLISQNRQSKIADLRQEIDMQVNLVTEEEITKLLRLVAGLYKALKINIDKDPELKEMLRPTDWDSLEEKLEKELLEES